MQTVHQRYRYLNTVSAFLQIHLDIKQRTCSKQTLVTRDADPR